MRTTDRDSLDRLCNKCVVCFWFPMPAFRFHQGDDKLVSDPHESIEEFEIRVREVTDHRLLVICAEYVEPE